MQKLKLLKNLKSSQFLSKDQLRSVTGGTGQCYCYNYNNGTTGALWTYMGSIPEYACGSGSADLVCVWG